MDDNQLAFDSLFKGFTYGLRGGFAPRDWHVECVIDYSASRSDWVAARAGNGGLGQHVFTIEAGTGSGKTHAGAHIASFHLNQEFSRFIVIVVPTNAILHRTIEVYREQFGIHLEPFEKRRYRGGFRSLFNGYVATYARLIQDPAFHRKICGPDVLVIFDEVHHLGDENVWGPAAVEAFGRCRHVLALTGTPYRSDNKKIPYVTYEEAERHGLLRFKADFNYSLGRAVSDSICRRPVFFYCDATVKMRADPMDESSPVMYVGFDPDVKVSEFVASERLRGAVRYGSSDRRRVLEEWLGRIREDNRKCVIFLGGDSTADDNPTVDAKNFLTDELHAMGITPEEYVVVVSDGEKGNAHEKIREFRDPDSKKWIIIAIMMVSEGVDIPDLSAAIFLTNVTAKQTTIQRIGRTLRLKGPTDPHKEAWIILFRDKALHEICVEIEKEVEHEVKLAKVKRQRQAGEGAEPTKRYRAESIGVGEGPLVEISFGGDSYGPEEFDSANDWLKANNYPSTYLHTLLELKLRRSG